MRRIAASGGFVALLLLALWLRLPDLALSPLHQDEGLNAWLTLALHWGEPFQYQPNDNHGPLLFYVGALAFAALGVTEVSLRLPMALAGSLVLLALIPVRRCFAGGGWLVAGLFVAIAPGLVYFSRAAIHEIYLVLFTALWAAGLVRFAQCPTPGWAALCAAAAAACFVTKETALLTAACLALAALVAASAWLAALPRGARRASASSFARAGVRAAPIGCLVFAAVIVVFYTSFFTHAAGLRAFFEAFGPWIEYGATGRNQGKPFGYFWELMAASEGAYRWLALPALLLAGWRRDPFGLALAGWTLAAWLLYSAIPYKTPWCVLEIDLPVFLLIGWAAGQGFVAAYDARRRPAARAVAGLAFAIALAPAPGLLAQSLEDVRERYDDPARPYVYYHTQRSFFALLEDLFGVSDAAPAADGRGPRVVNSDAFDPVRWYVHSRGWAPERTRYRENPAPPLVWIEEAQIVITSVRHLAEIRELIAATGEPWHEESYPARPGAVTTVFYRQSLWDRHRAAGGRAASPWPRAARDPQS